MPGKTVSGETETGMKLKVETFVDPADGSALKKPSTDWRAANRYPAVDFHRVTADNSAGASPDSGRTVRFAARRRRARAGKGVEARFSCDALAVRVAPGQGDRRRRVERDLLQGALRRRSAQARRASRPARARSTTS